MVKYVLDDTICALASPQGLGGIAVIRVSGSNALDFTKKLIKNKKLQWQSHKAYFSKLYSIQNSELIDEVVVTYFEKGKSFTGDETIEISCHGSPVISSSILQNLIQAGCRTAERGEFTYRAFMNQKIDLIQAESIQSLIESQSKQAARISLRQLEGDLSKKVSVLEDKLTYVLANMEASIDFSTEDIDVIDYEKCLENLLEVGKQIDQILSSYASGKILKNGLQISIVGKPNAGKSSLLNALVEHDKAIVSSQPGTTRDLVEADLVIEGVSVKLVDTAGIHFSENEVEQIGMERSRKAIENADYVFYVVDPQDNSLDEELFGLVKTKPYKVLYSKSDLVEFQPKFELDQAVLFSSLTGEAVDRIKKIISDKVKASFSEDSAVLIQARHFELFTKAKNRVDKSLKMIKSDASQEFVALELQEALQALFEILGKRFDDEVMDRVFREFCIGK